MFFIGLDVAKAKLDCRVRIAVASGKRKTQAVANSGIADPLTSRLRADGIARRAGKDRHFS